MGRGAKGIAGKRERPALRKRDEAGSEGWLPVAQGDVAFPAVARLPKTGHTAVNLLGLRMLSRWKPPRAMDSNCPKVIPTLARSPAWVDLQALENPTTSGSGF